LEHPVPTSDPPPRLWTIGHSSRTLPELLALLQAHAIAGVVDVRRVPRSRRHPHFGRERLAAALVAAGIRYDHRVGLGGMRTPDGTPVNAGLAVAAFRGYADYMQTAAFVDDLEALIALAGERRTAFMCAEAAPEDCHRSLIADAIAARGLAVEHILGDGRAVRHGLRDGARVRGRSVTYPALQGGLWEGEGGLSSRG
jgi:uncharacterized protein (DUF488 family)